MKHQADISAFAAALRRAVTAGSEEERLLGAEAVLAVLRPFLAQHGAKGRKRGPKPRFDRAWAEAQLLDMAITNPDGLPELQSVMADRLLARFVAADREQPSVAWALKVVSRFYAKAATHDEESRRKFRSDPEFKILFRDEEHFVACCRMRDRVDEKWRNDKALRDRYASSTDYFNAILQGAK